MKMTRRIFSLVLAMMMLVGTMFAIPAAAQDHEHLETELCGLFVMRDGVLVPLAELVESCGCSNPVIEDYSLEPPHPYRRTDHIVPFIQICTNCGWSYDDIAYAIGGCGMTCRLPYYYDYYD